MEIVPLDAANPSDVDAWFGLIVESQRVEFPHDPRPSRRGLVSSLSYEWPGQLTEFWLAKDGDATLGSAQIDCPTLDNLQSAWVDVLVGVRHRRRGVGTALVEQLTARARAHGRVRMIAEVREPLPGGADDWPGARFSDAMGARRVLPEMRRRLHLDRVDHAAVAQLARAAEAGGAGYRLVQWTDQTPEEHLKDIAYLEVRMSTDAPLGDLHWEPEVVDATRVRATDAALLAYGRRSYATAAVHEETGVIAGYTRYVLDEDVPEHAWQWSTIVAPEHRGHRLGMRLKLANLAWLQELAPAVRTVDTWNAAENTHMIAVNEAMGFVAIELGAEWQLDFDTAADSAEDTAEAEPRMVGATR